MIDRKTYIFLYLLFAIAVGFGLFLPLMENDSAQHATMAMTMADNDDFWNIYKNGKPYLDKPHMHFWLSAWSMKLLGHSVWAYRLPAILLTILAAYGISRLTILLYGNTNTGRIAGLLFLTSQAVVLSLFDVRTDAVLAAFSVLAMWQWARYLKKHSLLGAVFGGLFTAFAYASKGVFAIAVIGLFLFFVVLYENRWKRLWNWKLLIGLLFFLTGCMPMFYAYWIQFGKEGLEFITYGQSTGRFTGEDFGKTSQNDYFFYFHTLLWAFLPWSLWAYLVLFFRSKSLLSAKRLPEIASFSTVAFFMFFMNFSQFKLPHYLNVILPLSAIFVAAFVCKMVREKKRIKIFEYSQYFVLGIMLIGLLVLAGYVFPVNWSIGVLLGFCLLILCYFVYRMPCKIQKLLIASSGLILIMNIYLNSTFYRELLNYHGGNIVGQYVVEKQIPPDDIYMYDDQYSWSLDWFTRRTTPKKTTKELEKLKQNFWLVYYGTDPKEHFPQFQIDTLISFRHYRITRLKLGFLNPKTRNEKLEKIWLIKMHPKGTSRD